MLLDVILHALCLCHIHMYNHCVEDKEVGSSFASYIILDVVLHGKKMEAHSQQAPEAGGCATGDRGHRGDIGHRGKGDTVNSFKRLSKDALKSRLRDFSVSTEFIKPKMGITARRL